MIRLVACVLAMSIASPASSEVKNDTAFPNALLRTWTGAICDLVENRGGTPETLQITLTFTAIKGDRLVGAYRDATSMSVKFDPDTSLPFQATVSGNTLKIRVPGATMVLNYAGGALVGEYSRDKPSPRGCEQRERVRLK